MGFMTIKTSQGFDRVAQQVEIVPNRGQHEVIGKTMLQGMPTPIKVSSELDVSVDYYLDKNIKGSSKRKIPGETLSQLFVRPTSDWSESPNALVYVPLDRRAKTHAKVNVDMSGMSSLEAGTYEVYIRTAVALAVMAVADGTHREALQPQQKV